MHFCCVSRRAQGACYPGSPPPLHLEDLWIRDIITTVTGHIDTHTDPLRMLVHEQLDVADLITHTWVPLDGIVEAHDILAGAADTGVLKVVLTR